MHRPDTENSANRTVKLFPRLLPVNAITTRVRSERPVIRQQLTSVATAMVPNDRTQVRARLLRMILESERSRQNGQTPSAGSVDHRNTSVLPKPATCRLHTAASRRLGEFFNYL
jgi:hypothetical protein